MTGENVSHSLCDLMSEEDQKTRRELGLPMDTEAELTVELNRFVESQSGGTERRAREKTDVKPRFTVSGREVYVNTECVRMMPNVEYVQMLVDSEHKQLALRPLKRWTLGCLEWGRTVDERRYPSHRSAELLSWKLCQLIGCKTNYRYQFSGQLAKALDEYLLVFELNEPRAYDGKALIVDGRERIWPEECASLREEWTRPESHGNGTIRTFQSYMYIATDGKAVDDPSRAAEQRNSALHEYDQG